MRFSILRTGLLLGVISLLALPQISRAHCDTMNGPVVVEAQAALDKGDITPVLKWVKPEDEKVIREAFSQARAVRTKGPDAKALADHYFFETLVRIHRAGEGAPYTGLKDEQPEAIVAATDKALETSSSDALVKEVREAVSKGIEKRFQRVVEAKKHMNDNVKAGREFVEAYVEYIHYVERLHKDAMGPTAHHQVESDEADAETPNHEHGK